MPNQKSTDISRRTTSKVFWRLIPFLLLLYVVNMMDRVNLGYAALDMNEELAISAVAYGSLAAAFFVGYFFFEVPSNILLEKFGSRKTIGRIMVSWGIVTMLMFFAADFWHVYILRFLLGVMEAGFFPGIIFYLSLWFPAKDRARAVAYFFVGGQLGKAIAAPLTTFIMENVDWLGHSGWRWVFMIEGTPAVIMGIIAYYFLTDSPKHAKWLADDERNWLVSKLDRENAVNNTTNGGAVAGFKSIRVWHLAAIYLFFQAGVQVMLSWQPTIVKSFSQAFSHSTIGTILMIPPLLAAVIMVLWSRSSDLKGERKYHALFPIIACLVGIGAAVLSPVIIVKVLGIILFGATYPALYGVFWTLPSIYLTGAQAAVGIAIISSASSLSGFLANSAVGSLEESYGSGGVMTLVIGCLVLSAILMALLRVRDVMLRMEAGKESVGTRQSEPHSTDTVSHAHASHRKEDH